MKKSHLDYSTRKHLTVMDCTERGSEGFASILRLSISDSNVFGLYSSSVRLFHAQRRRFNRGVDSPTRLPSFRQARDPGNGTKGSLVLFNVLSIEGFELQTARILPTGARC